MTLNPTVVVGVGEAGCKMTSQVYEELVDIHGDPTDPDTDSTFLDDFKFITIDTRAQDLSRFAKDSFHDILLEPRNSLWNKNKSEFSYIHDGIDDLDPSGGASRQRPTARYYIDNAENFDDLYTELETLIHTFADDVNNDPNLWVLNSFGGGTGSGALPLLTAMLQEISQNSSKNFWFGGVGSLPRLDRLAVNDRIPAESKNLYANAYTALRELGVLIDYDFHENSVFADAGGTDYPVKIEMESSSSIRGSSTFEFSSSPYDFYGLMGLDESEGQSTKRAMNRVAANTALFFSEESGLEDFGDDLVSGDQSPILYSLDSSGVQVPVESLKDYTALLDELRGVSRRLRDARREVNRKRANRDLLRKVVDYDVEEGFDPGTELGIELLDTTDIGVGGADGASDGVQLNKMVRHVSELYEHAEDRADRFEKMQFSNQLVDDREESLLNTVPAVTDDIEFDTEPVATFFYYKKLAAAYETLESDHSFPETLENVWSNTKDEIEESSLSVDVVQLSQASPLERWDEALDEFHDKKIDAIEAAIEDTGWLRGRDKRQELEEKKEQWRAQYEELRTGAREYERILTGRDTAESRARDVRVKARNFSQEFDQKLQDDLEPKEADIRNTYNSLEKRRETLESRLEDFTEQRFTDIPFTSFQDVSPGVIETAESIGELVSGGVIEKEDVVSATRHGIGRLSEGLEDVQTTRVEPEVRDFLGLLSSDANSEIVDGTYDGDVHGNGVKQAFNNFNDSDIVTLDDDFSLRMVALYAQISTENTSEFGTIHEKYRSPQNVSSEFGVDINDDEFITGKFAYPEFFPEDDDIQRFFGSGSEVAIEPQEE